MKTALITGASSGIGLAFAQELAAQKINVVLVARSTEKLQQIADQLQTEHQIQTHVIDQDLTLPNSAQAVFEHMEATGIPIDLLINNAGFGDFGKFTERQLDKQLNMIQLNIAALVALTYLFLPGMTDRGSGGIINVASIAAYQPLPYLSVYAASKAFVLHFSEALWAENKASGVKILALCPGPTESQFADVAEFPPAMFDKANNGSLESAKAVVQGGLRALNKNYSNQVTGGIGNQVVVNVSRFLPRPWLVSAMEKQFKV